jgi:glutamate decarboxylase
VDSLAGITGSTWRSDFQGLGGEIRTFGLNFSRPIGHIVAQYYNLLRLGKEGYRKIHQTCSDTAAFFSHELHKMGPFEILNAGRDGIPGVCWKGKPEMRDFTLYDLSNRLSTRGWRVPAYTLPPNLSEVVVMRIVVRHGVSRALISSLLKEIRAALDFFAAQAIAQPLSSE